MNNADLIVKYLVSAGITRGFGVPSGNVLPLLEAMRTGGLEFVLTAHEGSAGFCADVTGRLTGRPGLCVSTLGPGATNLATGVGCAYLDRSPVIAITCNIATGGLGRRVQMHVDHHALFGPIAKASIALRAGGIADALTEALRLALAEPQGPVHLDLPEDVARAPADEAVAAIPQAEHGPPPSAAALARGGALLAAARRPVAVIGANARRMAEHGLLRRFVERNGLPFASTCMGKGMIDEDHGLSIGCIERARRQNQRAFLHGADLIVGLGYDEVEAGYGEWIGGVPLLHVDLETIDADPSVRLVHQITGDLDACLAGLLALPAADNEWTDDELAGHRETFHRALRPPGARFPPHQAMDVIRQVLPEDGILTVDVGAHTHQIASQWTAHAPGTFLVTNGWSSMGFALPAALAAKLAQPQRPVVCLMGDGGFQMSCGELAAAKRQGLAFPVVVLDDRALSLIKVKQQREGLVVHGTEWGAGEMGQTPAHYFGVPAVGVGDEDGLRRALSRALEADGPTLIEARVDPQPYGLTVFD